MDKAPIYTGRSNGQQSTQTPPWRTTLQRGSNGQVDSWRSYSNDASNLQTSTASTLNAAAQPFQPSPRPQQHYKPYQPLRVSNGTAERSIVATANEGNNSTNNKQKTTTDTSANAEPPIRTVSADVPLARTVFVEPSAAFVSRYPVRRNRGLADQPIPSIEEPSSYILPVSRVASTRRNHTPNSRVTSIPRDHPPASPSSPNPRYHVQARARSPKVPEATVEYKSQAQKEPAKLAKPRKLLVVLDLNGTLLYRSRASANAKVHMRPGVTPLVDYLFDNHVVMVYTSATPASAVQMVNQFLHPTHRNKLAAMWARDKLDLTKEQFVNKVQVYKKLDKIWDDQKIQETAEVGNRWDQSNTILVDDSKLKALAQPHNLLQVPEYTSKDDPTKAQSNRKQVHKIQQDILKQLEMKLEELRDQEDVSRLIRKWQAGEAQVPRLQGQEVVVEETVDQKRKQEEENTESTKHNQLQPHLLTPDSIGDVSGTRYGDSEEQPLQISDDDEEDAGAPLSPASSHVSSIDENVFRELLEDTGK